MRAMTMSQQKGMNGAGTAAVCTVTDSMTMQQGYGSQGRVSDGQNGQQGSGNADCLQLSALADGMLVLDAEATAGLLYMIEEEKMARDLYDAFADQTGSVVFDRISDSEQRHLDSLVLVAEKAGIDLSGISTIAGTFTNPELQSLYNTLLAQGSVSLDAAYNVGILVEQTDIADLQAYEADMEIGIVGTVYAHLEAGSEHHLAAFTQQAALV